MTFLFLSLYQKKIAPSLLECKIEDVFRTLDHIYNFVDILQTKKSRRVIFAASLAEIRILQLNE